MSRTTVDYHEIYRDYQSGLSFRQLAIKYEVSDRTIRTKFKQLGLKSRVSTRTDITKTLLKRMYITEMKTIKAIAGELNCGPNTVHRKLRDYGIEIRKTAEFEGSTLEYRSERWGRKGESSGRWRGGMVSVSCVICGSSSLVAPYVNRKIESGERAACCGPECVLMYARRNQKFSNTSIEIKMANELKRRGLNYIDQYLFKDKFRLDFLLPDHNVVIECDGDYWHNLPHVIKRDNSKNAYLRACGYRVFRFWERDINADIVKCVDEVIRAIEKEGEAVV
ncbi:endonuclease domain-containing protein [Paenibacillus luteus]|uniref:endonuclease domain-containing protein n=1 Tax=Paenibacillus luteus TaxID=2545753 RepID=UPI0011418C89|nr:DUF559 domain-containing protein [Paenibacillus luteus]